MASGTEVGKQAAWTLHALQLRSLERSKQLPLLPLAVTCKGSTWHTLTDEHKDEAGGGGIGTGVGAVRAGQGALGNKHAARGGGRGCGGASVGWQGRCARYDLHSAAGSIAALLGKECMLCCAALCWSTHSLVRGMRKPVTLA